ncbi:MAG: glycoside hydrolase family 92 protein [Proteobacteria bacterium]|nr:glycoside hydrolase family 92 protein [Pseudomonadota bacterium]
MIFALGCGPGEEPLELPAPDPIHDEVDVFVGTGGRGFGVGSTYPGPRMPFGMIQPGPDTQGEFATISAQHCAGYRGEDPWITGFSQIHSHGMGTADYGVILLQPQQNWTGTRDELEYRLAKGAEEGRPGYYAVEIEGDAGMIDVALTTADRAAVHRYTFPEAAGAGVLLDLAHTLPDGTFHDAELTTDGAELSGWTHFSGAYSGRHGGEQISFVARFDPAPTVVESWDEEDAVGAHLSFDATEVTVRIGISFLDVDGARANLDADVGTASFDEVLEDAEAVWEDRLAAFAVAGGSDFDRAVYASSAYHALMMPTLLTDADGRYPGFDGEAHEADGFTYYSDFSLWDTYRTQHPLLNLMWPEIQSDFLASLMAMHDQGGHVPQWPLGTGYTGGMIGKPETVVFADALIRGVGGDAVDLDDVVEALLITADQKERHAEYVERGGWISMDTGGNSVSITMEYGWADAAFANLVSLAGDNELAADLRDRSRGWRNLFDSETGFVRPRAADGTWLDPFDPETHYDHFVEGNAWQYTFMAPQDVPGLVEGYGSTEALLQRLDQFFLFASYEEDPVAVPPMQYWHGNEPDIHSAFLFALLGQRDQSVLWSRWVEDAHYGLGYEGLPGNEDAGTMGAWYVFSAGGLYPIAGTTDYVLTEPRFPLVRLRAGDGWLTTAKVGDGPWDQITVDGQVWTQPIVPWSAIANGAEILWSTAE